VATPITSRHSNRYMGNSNPERNQVHDLRENNSQCRIEKTIEEGDAVVFSPDTLQQAYAEGYVPCDWCIGITAATKGEGGSDL
jgi:hypothetical protein